MGIATMRRVPEEMKSHLVRAITVLDQALMGWDIVGSDLVQAVNQFFLTSEMSRQWNSTAITLVPKTNAPSTIKDYRPITCCCVSKILANRLQPILPSLITPFQSAFIKGRSIRIISF